MNEAGITDPTDVEAVRKLGVMDLPMIQRKMNFHLAVTLDLFGNEVSTNAASAYEAGIKGRYQETRIDDDHQLHNDTYAVLKVVDGELKMVEETALNAINARLRDDYVKDAEGGVKRWNKLIKKAGFDYELSLPHIAFNRQIGEFSGLFVSPDGAVIDQSIFEANRDTWLPTASDLAYLDSLMRPVTEPGQYAGWIAPPKIGIDNKPGDFEYVRLAG